LLWIAELLRWVKPRLPAGYRAYVGTSPTVGIGAPERPDLGVRLWPDDTKAGSPNGPTLPSLATDAPDQEIAVASLETSPGLMMTLEGRLVAVVELVTPRDKDRTAARDAYLGKYLGYLLEGVHLLLVDVHRRPLSFSFADRLAVELGMEQPSLPAPYAVSYRVGETAPMGGKFLALWRRPLEFGQQLPTLPLPLTVEQAVAVDLEATYGNAARDAYLS